MTQNQQQNKPKPHALPMIRRKIWLGFGIIIIFFSGFGLWSTLAPLESATIAQGTVKVLGNRRTIQHLEGGIIKKILVKDGSIVTKGEVLIQLDNTQPEAALNLTRNEIYHLIGNKDRLEAEQNKMTHIQFSPELFNQGIQQASIQKIKENQISIFNARNNLYHSSINILTKQIAQLKDEQIGIEAQLDSNMKQRELIAEEIKSVSSLEKSRLIEKSKLLELLRHQAKLAGIHGESIARVATLKQREAEINAKIVSTKQERRKDIFSELRESQQRLYDLSKKKIVEQDILARTAIRAPQNGAVVGLQVHTIGGVIKPSEQLMDIVPNEKLEIIANIKPTDIDAVHKGLVAKVSLIAYKTRNMPYLMGTVTDVSADALATENKESYYGATIDLPKKQLDELPQNASLYPGMPVQVMIITEKRTLLDYLLTPVKDSFNRAFREQ